MGKKSGSKAPNPVAAVTLVNQRIPEYKRLLAIVIASFLVLGGLIAYVRATRAPSSSSGIPSIPPATVDPEKTGKTSTYVGAKVCMTCHEEEFRAWSGSHHDLAMQKAAAESVLGNFADGWFRHQGVESRFFKRGDRFMVRTDGPEGTLADYEIAYTLAFSRCSNT